MRHECKITVSAKSQLLIRNASLTIRSNIWLIPNLVLTLSSM